MLCVMLHTGALSPSPCSTSLSLRSARTYTHTPHTHTHTPHIHTHTHTHTAYLHSRRRSRPALNTHTLISHAPPTCAHKQVTCPQTELPFSGHLLPLNILASPQNIPLLFIQASTHRHTHT